MNRISVAASRALLLSLTILLFYSQSIGQSSAKKALTLGAADTLFFARKWEDARRIYESTVKQTTPDKVRPATWARLGYCYQMGGNYDVAMQNYKHVLELKQINPQLKFTVQSRMARIYSIKKDLNQSIAWLDSATRLGYVNLYELDTLKDYANVKKDKRFDALYQRVYVSIYPCLGNPKHREFDFWIGEWEVFTTGTTSPKVGNSLIQRVSGGCLILENWTGFGSVPSDGKSMNYFDTTTDRWEQIWMGSGGGLAKFTQGIYRDGAMRFAVDPTYVATGTDGKKPVGRFSFYNVSPTQVRQWQEQSTDNGTTWQTVYDYTYIRK